MTGKPITPAEYSQMGDFAQADLQTVNSLCEYLSIEVNKDGKQFKQDYAPGIAQHDLYMRDSTDNTGTKVILIPDSAIFGDAEFSRKHINYWINENTSEIKDLSILVKDV